MMAAIQFATDEPAPLEAGPFRAHIHQGGVGKIAVGELHVLPNVASEIDVSEIFLFVGIFGELKGHGSVEEMPGASEVHADPGGLRGGYHLWVADRTTRLDDGADTGGQ